MILLLYRFGKEGGCGGCGTYHLATWLGRLRWTTVNAKIVQRDTGTEKSGCSLGGEKLSNSYDPWSCGCGPPCN